MQCVNLTYMNCDERIYAHTILIELVMMMIIQVVDPMTLTKIRLIIKGLKTFQKGSLAHYRVS